MQVTELFTSGLESAIRRHKHGDITGFLPLSHTSVPDIQENMMYICASGRFTVQPMEEITFQDVEGFLLLYTQSGHGNIEITGDRRKMNPHSLLLWDCRDYIKLCAGNEPWSGITIFFDGNTAGVFYEEICKLSFPMYDIAPSSADECCLRELMAFGTITSPHRAIAENKILTDMLTSLLFRLHKSNRESEDSVVPEYLTEVRKLFDENYADEFSMEKLAVRFGVNRYRLSREFSRYFGIPPVKYLTKVRLEHAKILLETTATSVSRIGTAVGIDNTTHFIKLFKAQNGITPQLYREKYLSFRELSKD